MEIRSDIMKWLLKLNAVSEEDITRKKGICKINKKSVSKFTNGGAFTKILSSMMDEQITQQNKNRNWPTTLQALHKLNINVDNYHKSQLLSGNDNASLVLINRLYAKSAKREHSKNNAISLNEIKPHYKSSIVSETEMNDIEECLTFTQFMIKAITTSLLVGIEEAKALLANNCKLLKAILIKGYKSTGDYSVNWLKYIGENKQLVIKLIVRPQVEFSLLLSCVAASLYSRYRQVVEMGIRLLVRYGHDNEWYTIGQEWINKDGIEGLVYAMRFEGFDYYILMAIYEFSNGTALGHPLKDACKPCDYLDIVMRMMAQLNRCPREVRDAAVENGIHVVWADASAELGSYTFMTELWKEFFIDYSYECLDRMVLLYKTSVKQGSNSMKMCVISAIISMLEFLSEKRNEYAPVLYKLVTLAAVECNSEMVIDHIISSIDYIFGKLSAIPVSIFMEPFIQKVMYYSR
jgi:hypothetical protein